MQESLTREIGLLRTLATHLEGRPLPFESLTQELLRREGLGHVRQKAGGIIAIRVPGHHAFTELTDCLLDRLPGMERGAIYVDIQTELFSFIEDYVGRDPSTVGSKDAEAVVAHFEKWFADKASPRRVFVPCVISRTPAPRFEIGPVTFEFIDRVATSSFYPRGGEDAALDRQGFDDLVRWMQEQDADWLARVSVDGCEQKRAEEIAELAVDLVIVGLQLAAPYLDTRTMARLDARRGTSQKRTLSEADGYHNAGWTRKEPGMAIGQGTLPDILQKAAPIFVAVGNVVRSFAAGSFRLPALERAWCDAAYWFHQALAESIDTIAIAKLETALEVLLRAESSKGSERRMFEILSAFFGLGPDDPITPGSPLTARQFARNVVRDRSRILHGTWSTLNARGIDRSGMEGFVVTVLRTAVIELEAYIHSAGRADDIDEFLKWVELRRTTSVPANI
ncbi:MULTISPECIES: hypothetical protein [unclassified Paraburkholderia]|uniref:hypothetical protein n=1 Tax=unclassified Paraburkholderia TaxID=2615204 RepID=UPI00160DBFE4|nr:MULTISPECIES: hypothetical protein [unclassified Paraburkholderia]MBB5442708.1 hypothetical protein [Paraburkholderia sp. WSM4177]MBB5482485.1 hypothetical protein [Paraburkholderia sp. WSM4180]